MKAFPIIAASACAALSACLQYPGDAPIVDAPVVRASGPVALGEGQRVGSVVVTPLTVTEDSRCPASVQCVQAGTVKVATRIDGAGWRETIEFQLREPQTIRGQAIVLKGVAPGRSTPGTIAADDYRFNFDVAL